MPLSPLRWKAKPVAGARCCAASTCSRSDVITQHIEVHTDEDGIGWIRLDRPERRNALTFDMRVHLTSVLRELGGNPAVRVVVLCATGSSFCSGADLEQFTSEGPAEARARLKTGAIDLTRTLHAIEKPVIAAVNGPAVGLGWTLALACDMLIAAESATFALPYSRLGLVPDAGALYFLSRAVPHFRAMEIMLSGRTLAAAEAGALGLTTEIVADRDLLTHVTGVAKRLANGPTFAFGMAKVLMQKARDPGLEAYLVTEMMVPPQLRNTHDYAEGLAAFREKRAASFKGC